jgi:hypothetical protein
MNPYDDKGAASFAGTKRHLCAGILALYLLSLSACASMPGSQSTLNHETTPAGIADASKHEFQPGTDYGRGPSDPGIAALVDILKKKNVISADEAARFTEQSLARTSGQKGVASSSEELKALVALLESKKIIGADEAAQISKQYGAPTGEEKGYVITPDINNREQAAQIAADVTAEIKQGVHEQVEQQVHEELPVEVQKAGLAAAAPEWVKRIRFGGDVRLRYEKDLFGQNNDSQLPAISQGMLTQSFRNTTNNTDRFKYRIRVGAAVDVNDQLEAVVRLSSGNTSTPVSTNDIMGTYLNKDIVLFDLAYLRWHPDENFSVYGGRIPNLFYSSDLVWAPDLNFEGLAFNFKKPVSESLTPFLTGGVFPLEQNDFTQHDKWLVGGQLGLEEKNQKDVGGTIAAAYYYYSNVTGVLNTTNVPNSTTWSAPLYEQYGNTLFLIDPTNNLYVGLASKFEELNINGDIDVGFWDPVHIILMGDYVKNLGFNNAAVQQLVGPGVTERTVGYQVGLTVGYPVIEKFAQWNVSLNYKFLGGDAVIDAFTDPDFHLGGTNAKGWILGAQFGLAKNAWLRLRYLTADQIAGPPLAIDVLQLDFNARF